MKFNSAVVIGILAVLTAGAAITIFSQSSKKSHSASLLETFARWKVEHGKLYSTPSENTYRLEVFAGQLSFVQKSNADYEAKMAAQNVKLSGPMFEMNAFGDLTEEEFSAMYTGDLPPTEEFASQGEETEASPVDAQEPEPVSNLGASFTPKVRHQGGCGSCWAFSAMVEFERLVFNQKGQYIDLSHQELVDCVTSCNGCSGGGSEKAYNYVTSKGGISQATSYPYVSAQKSCRGSSFPKVQISGTSTSKYQLFSFTKAKLAASKGVIATVSVYSSGAFRYFSKTDDVFDGRGHSDCGTRTGHAIGVVSFNGDVARVLNSWGEGWGVRGYKNIRACDSGRLFGTGGRFVYPYSW